MTTQPTQKPWWEKDFEENYSPIYADDVSNSSWKYGAPSPLSIKRFIALVEARKEKETLERAAAEVRNFKPDHTKSGLNLNHGTDEIYGCIDCYDDKQRQMAGEDIAKAIESLGNKPLEIKSKYEDNDE